MQHDLEHLLAFGFAGLIVALAYPHRLFLMASAGVAYTLALEIIQIPLASRHAQIEDLRRGCSGRLCGSISGLSCPGFFAKKQFI
jgi:hypothetical protein